MAPIRTSPAACLPRANNISIQNTALRNMIYAGIAGDGNGPANSFIGPFGGNVISHDRFHQHHQSFALGSWRDPGRCSMRRSPTTS